MAEAIMSKTFSKLTAALAACTTLAAAPAWAADFPAGVYATKGATMSFGHGHFRVTQHDAMKVEGAYKVDGERIQFTDASGPWACTKRGEHTGSYKWKADDGGLAFTTISDACKDRAGSLTKLAWKKK